MTKEKQRRSPLECLFFVEERGRERARRQIPFRSPLSHARHSVAWLSDDDKSVAVSLPLSLTVQQHDPYRILVRKSDSLLSPLKLSACSLFLHVCRVKVGEQT